MLNKTKFYNQKTRKTSLFIYEIEVWEETKILNRFPTSQNLFLKNNNMDPINVLPKQTPFETLSLKLNEMSLDNPKKVE